ncbi:MAG: Pr6Pr family membrane protein [Christensenellaceae bacterium]|jgi:hypothetical protein|nr:Pr6Pr family membrane protein [Christensenellaceae bacterium]
MIRNRKFALVFRTVAFLIAISGLLDSFISLTHSIDGALFMYYTVQSNILACVMFGLLIVCTAKGLKKDGTLGSSSYLQRFEMVACVDLLLTLLVFWVLLTPTMFKMTDGGVYLWSYENLSVHLITPLLCLIDYILFSYPRKLKYIDVYLVLIFPISYLAFATIAGFSGYVFSIHDGAAQRFPYFFMDYDLLGALTIVYILALIIIFLLISHVFYYIDHKFRKIPD